MQRFHWRFKILPDASYLDVGCGLGEFACVLGLKGAGRVVGIDINTRFIDTAKRSWDVLCAQHPNLPKDRVSFVAVHSNQWKPTEQFDVVISNEALEHIEWPKEFISRLSSFLRPEGKVVLAFGPLFHSIAGRPSRRFL